MMLIRMLYTYIALYIHVPPVFINQVYTYRPKYIAHLLLQDADAIISKAKAVVNVYIIMFICDLPTSIEVELINIS